MSRNAARRPSKHPYAWRTVLRSRLPWFLIDLGFATKGATHRRHGLKPASKFISAVPVLASLDIERSAEFFSTRLGFDKVHVAQGEYGIVAHGPVEIHFWPCADRRIAEATGCRVQVQAIDALYDTCVSQAIVHPSAPLASKPWGTREFSILDPDGNLVTFFDEIDESS